MNYALIENGIVTNIIWLYPGNVSDFPNAVPLGEVPAGIGDTYADGVFYRDGEKVLSAVEQAQKTIAEYETALSEIETALGV